MMLGSAFSFVAAVVVWAKLAQRERDSTKYVSPFFPRTCDVFFYSNNFLSVYGCGRVALKEFSPHTHTGITQWTLNSQKSCSQRKGGRDKTPFSEEGPGASDEDGRGIDDFRKLKFLFRKQKGN